MKPEDVITIKIHGSWEERQEIVDRFCEFAMDLAEELQEQWGKTRWGWTLESSIEPKFIGE